MIQRVSLSEMTGTFLAIISPSLVLSHARGNLYLALADKNQKGITRERYSRARARAAIIYFSRVSTFAPFITRCFIPASASRENEHNL